jgi:ABC-2 type transport system ATP-binding protein
MNLIEIKNVTKQYKKSKAGVFGVNFDIPKGAKVGFVGDNGAGKTTLINIIFQTLTADSGEILLNKLPIKDNLDKIALLPDNQQLPQGFKLIDFISYIGELKGMKPGESKERAKDLLTSLDLGEYFNKQITDLSAGMKKRSLLAGAIMNDSEAIFLDEPTANLDVGTRLDFFEILDTLNKKGKTIFITSHIISELQDFIDYLIIIDGGKIIHAKPFDSKKEQIEDIYKSKRKDQKESKGKKLADLI